MDTGHMRQTDSTSEERPARQQKAGNDYDQEKRPADKREGFDECSSPARVFPYIDAVIDHRSQGTDQGTEPGSIRTVDQA